MKIKPITYIALAGLLTCAAPSFAAVVTVDFEGVSSFGSVSNYYNGGTDIPPSGPGSSGPNLQLSFGSDALAFTNDGSGPGPLLEFFSNAPGALTPLGGTVMAPVGSGASLTATGGSSFIDSVSFYYSATQALTVDVVDASDNVLGSVNLAANNGSCGASPYCLWTQETINFSGVGQSIRFGSGYDPAAYSGLGGTIAAFDNIQVNAVPVPAAGWLLASGLAALGGRLRRKRSA